MKVALVLFPISMEGGLATRALHTFRLFETTGHDPTFFRVVYTDAKHLKGRQAIDVAAGGAGLKVSQWNLSIADRSISETLRVLDEFDLLVFLHAAPHVTDRQRAVKNWRLLYTEPHGRKLAYFSDQFASELYPWITDVAMEFEAIGINPPAAAHASKLLGAPVRTAPAPYVYPPADLEPDRPPRVLWTSGWRRSKGIMRFVEAAPRINAAVAIYGVGRDLHAFKKTPAFAELAGSIKGAAPPATIEDALRHAAISCDFTGQSPKYHGHYNRATIEPMLLGCVSAVMPTMAAPNSPIPRDAVLAISPADPAEAINRYLANRSALADVARRGHDWARAYFEPRRVMRAMLDGDLS